MRDTYQKYGGVILIACSLFFLYQIIKPFIKPIIGAAIIAYIFYPVYNFLLKKIRKKNLTAFLMCIIILIIVVLPFLFVLNSLLNEIPSAYSFLSNAIQNSQIWQDYVYNKFYQDLGINLDIGSLIGNLMSALLRYIQNFLTSIPSKIFNIMISAIFLFFFFRDGYGFVKKLAFHLPFRKKDIVIIIRELKKTADAVIYGQIITAVLQAIAATIAYSLLGVSSPLFWGIITLFASIIPMVGPAFVYVPLSLSLIGGGIVTKNTAILVKGIVLLAYGLGIVSSIDNIVKPIVISDKVRMHPLLVLVSVIGGLYAFGVIGIVLGPLIMVFSVTMFNIYEMKEDLFDHMDHSKKK